MTDEDDDARRQAWSHLIEIYIDFLDGWAPSPTEIGVLVKGTVKKDSVYSARIKRRGITLH
jgi:hypothetical protein